MFLEITNQAQTRGRYKNIHRAKLNHICTDGYTSMSSERDINGVCATLKHMNVDYKQHHRVSIGESHFSKVHLGFSGEAWMKLFKNHIY